MEARYGSALGSVGGMAGSTQVAPPKPVNPSCFGNLEDVVGTADSAAGRVERLVNRLIGEEPSNQAQEGKNAAFGLLNIADEHCRDIRKCMQRIFYAVERLEKQLP